MKPTYQPEEVQGILQWAIAHQVRQGEPADTLSQAQLQEIAQELGIPPDDLALAEQAWRQEQSLQFQRGEFHRWRWRLWQEHLVRSVLVTTLVTTPFFLWDWMRDGRVLVWTSQGLAWPYYLPVLVATPLGLLVLWHLGQTLQREGSAYERDWQAWQRHQRFQQIQQKAVRKLSGVVTWLERLLGD
ncbi:hypothetical protein GlitD10_0901 [Gloeomargarita lithophora Alchichica-D10]|uniref:2TM domain-containing protein n=1 Tax=Gloeomargarita lithophora Alchichica-D10 TaxID=1188229 RepID=A0A1J0ABA5_9CYAN|nr:hypothetical protein [Gloeomargarita lithophora]APB33219.1 hypothetical protein GlitD10_0901 [Gloeomargarita lithophora Alchichica-D10]